MRHAPRRSRDAGRRNFLASAVGVAATLTLPGCATSASRRRRRIGHTGITWGYSADNAPDAIRDVAALGFHGFESFGSVLEAWQLRGGLQAQLDAVHQHTGSCITTRDETWAVMEAVNTRHVKLCPDTGELLAAGIDPRAAIQHFGEIIAHVHIKDYDGGVRHDGYTPVGVGRVDVPAILDLLEKLPGKFMVMAELNPDMPGNRADATTPRRAAEQSRAAFAAMGYTFRS